MLKSCDQGAKAKRGRLADSSSEDEEEEKETVKKGFPFLTLNLFVT